MLLKSGGGLAVALSVLRAGAAERGVAEIAMVGREDGSRVWFDPIGLQVAPGTTVRWSNRDRTNSHTATAYHPSVMQRPMRIPEGAAAWDSGYLLPGETFSVTLREPGVYDYYCLPHEQAGMVGRIVVGRPRGAGDADYRPGQQGADVLPQAALAAFPATGDIIRHGEVRWSAGN